MAMNCLIVDDEETSRSVVQNYAERTEFLSVVGVLDNAIDAFKTLQEKHIDVLFLDIEMPEMTGIDLVKSLEHLPQVILITSRKDFAAEAFEYSLTDYLIKPVQYPRFLKAVEKARKSLTREVVEMEGQGYIYVKTNGRIVRLKLPDIYFIEALSDYVVINTKQKKYIVHATMKNIEKRLTPARFARVHRSFIVNIDKVEAIEDSSMEMLGRSIPIGASYKESFLSKLPFL